MPSLSLENFTELVSHERIEQPDTVLAVPIGTRLLSDQLTPVLAYRRLVAPDERTAPSFLLESVEGGERQGRYSILGARPVLEVEARGRAVTITDRRRSSGGERTEQDADPFEVLRSISGAHRLVMPRKSVDAGLLPRCVLGGWFGYAGYDTVRYAEPERLASPPPDDRGLADLHFGFYDGVVAFDHVEKLVYIVQICTVGPGDDPAARYREAIARLGARAAEIQRHSKPLPSGRVPAHPRAAEMPSNMTREDHARMVDRALEYIRAGDIFQVVLGQRFERRSKADPFDVYRALRAVNPSPYMVYLQSPGCILVASSPEILCRVERVEGGRGADRFRVTNRPLAGTRPRGRTPDEDVALERELLADAKERAEHIMLVDLGRNDVGRVAEPGSIKLPDLMIVERYSHVMHISSTVTGKLRDDQTCWDALQMALPVGTVSGAPKVRAMQIIDELEPTRRGPYAGAVGYADFAGNLDMAIALRTMVIRPSDSKDGQWIVHLQAGGGIVAESDPDAEHQETVNKAAAMAKAVHLAQQAFGQ